MRIMKNIPKEMTISELSRAAQVPVSTIKYYIRKGLFPTTIKIRKTKALYTSKHLNRIELIKKIQSKGNMTLAQIKEITDLVDREDGEDCSEIHVGAEEFKTQIINSATAMFKQKGYDMVSISDVINNLNIGRSTFYKHFKNKKDLFIECIQHMIENEAEQLGLTWAAPEEDSTSTIYKHAELMYQLNPSWSRMINMLRTATTNNPDEFTDNLDTILHRKIDIYENNINEGIKAGLIRRINARMLAIIVLAILEYSPDYLVALHGDGIDSKKVYEDIKDIFLNGVLKK
jgi:AcrR family transcriptional regulator